MAARRQAHKAAHDPCPNGKVNWAECDAVAAHQWGLCKAVVGDKEPEPCSRWSVGEEGWCWQHYTSETDRVKREARIAIEKADLTRRIDEYIAEVAERPSLYDSPFAPKPGRDYSDGIPSVELAAGAGVEPATSRVTADRSTAELPRKRKGPHRLTSPA